jgi:flagellar hook-length control protein FliK
MSRVEEDREAQRLTERLLEQKRKDEAKTRQRKEGETAFSRLMGEQKTQTQQAQRSTQEEKKSLGQSVLAKLKEQAGAKESTLRHGGQQAEHGRTSQRRLENSAQQSTQESRQTSEGHQADDSRGAQRSEGRKSEAKAYREMLEERSEARSNSQSNAGALAGRGGKGELKADSEGGQGSKQGGGDGKDKDGGGAMAGAFRFNPALMAPVPAAQPKQTSQSERLRRVATEIAEKIVERVRVGTNAAGNAEFQIDLRGEVLSGLSIKLSAKNGRIQAVFSGSNKDVLKMLEEQSESLKQALSGRGLTLEQLKIEAKV